MNGTVHGPAAAARPPRGGRGPSGDGDGPAAGHRGGRPRRAAGAGARRPVPPGRCDGRGGARLGRWPGPSAPGRPSGRRSGRWRPAALAGAVALTAARLASQPPVGQHQLARAVATAGGGRWSSRPPALAARPARRPAGRAGPAHRRRARLSRRRWAPALALALGRPAVPVAGRGAGAGGGRGCALPAVRLRYLPRQRRATGSGCSGSPSAWSWPWTRPWSSWSCICWSAGPTAVAAVAAGAARGCSRSA